MQVRDAVGLAGGAEQLTRHHALTWCDVDLAEVRVVGGQPTSRIEADADACKASGLAGVHGDDRAGERGVDRRADRHADVDGPDALPVVRPVGEVELGIVRPAGSGRSLDEGPGHRPKGLDRDQRGRGRRGGGGVDRRTAHGRLARQGHRRRRVAAERLVVLAHVAGPVEVEARRVVAGAGRGPLAGDLGDGREPGGEVVRAEALRGVGDGRAFGAERHARPEAERVVDRLGGAVGLQDGFLRGDRHEQARIDPGTDALIDEGGPLAGERAAGSGQDRVDAGGVGRRDAPERGVRRTADRARRRHGGAGGKRNGSARAEDGGGGGQQDEFATHRCRSKSHLAARCVTIL